MPVQRIGDLDIDQDLAFQQKQWRVQRGAWLAGVLVLLLALSGLFGGGPLANASVSDTTNALTVDHERIERRHSPSTLSLNVVPAGTQPTLQLWVNASFLNDVEITNIQPEPSGMVPDGDRTILEFDLADPSQPADIRITFEHQKIGPASVEIGLVDGPRLDFRQFVLP